MAGVGFLAALGGAVNFVFDLPGKITQICVRMEICDAGPETEAAVIAPIDVPLPADLVGLVNAEGAVDQRVAGDLVAYLETQSCPALRLKLNPVSQRDTPAASSASGQPGVFLDGSVTLMNGGAPQTIDMVGTGKGPAAFENAYDNFIESAVAGLSAAAPDCVKGSTE
ncbi:hypothetical protein [Actibacterium ureilyticum]|uniref:hypothetical protein n=1 Tax=Actibacterium ureilyticum TaxID=1590614 RepID=UPI001140CC2D|nr:hypothetical protein [Actibacterium ureilyticum]